MAKIQFKKSKGQTRWLNEALSFSRDASEDPEYDPISGAPKPVKARFADISVKDMNSHWVRFQSAAREQLTNVRNETPG